MKYIFKETRKKKAKVSVGSLLVTLTLVICLAWSLPDFSSLKMQSFSKELIWEDTLSL